MDFGGVMEPMEDRCPATGEQISVDKGTDNSENERLNGKISNQASSFAA